MQRTARTVSIVLNGNAGAPGALAVDNQITRTPLQRHSWSGVLVFEVRG
jgi:hypothetical protein